MKRTRAVYGSELRVGDMIVPESVYSFDVPYIVVAAFDAGTPSHHSLCMDVNGIINVWPYVFANRILDAEDML